MVNSPNESSGLLSSVINNHCNYGNVPYAMKNVSMISNKL